MFQNKKVRIVVAIIIAIVCWAYVKGSVNPNIVKNYPKVEVSLINQDKLAEEDLAIESMDIENVDVELLGQRVDLAELSAKDITVTADVYGVHEGNNYVSLEYKAPKDTKISNKSDERVMVKVAKAIKKDFDIEVKQSGTLDKNTTLDIQKLSVEKVTAIGTEKNIAKIDKVVATINVENATEEQTKANVKLVALDESGKEVKYITLSEDNVDVTWSIVNIKTVDLQVETVGEVASGYEIDKMDIPKTVEIIGTSEALENIKSVRAQSINLTNISSDTKVELEISLPKGVHLKSNVYATIKLKAKDASKELSYEAKDIVIQNLPSGLKAEISSGVNLTVGGNKDVINDITKQNITLYIDLSNANVGTRKATVKYKTTSGDINVKLASETVEVEISEE